MLLGTLLLPDKLLQHMDRSEQKQLLRKTEKESLSRVEVWISEKNTFCPPFKFFYCKGFPKDSLKCKDSDNLIIRGRLLNIKEKYFIISDLERNNSSLSFTLFLWWYTTSSPSGLLYFWFTIWTRSKPTNNKNNNWFKEKAGWT